MDQFAGCQARPGPGNPGHGDHRQPQSFGRRTQCPTVRDGSGSSHEVFRERQGHQRSPIEVLAGQEDLRLVADHEQPLPDVQRVPPHVS